MPSSVAELFKNVSLRLDGPVRWGLKIPESGRGVYVVSLSACPEEKENRFGSNPPIDLHILDGWIASVPTLRIDEHRPTPNALKQRLASLWLPDETVLYIGRTAASLADRIDQYYKTPLGECRPHAGGHWLKTLSVLETLSIYWAATPGQDDAETDLLRFFIDEVSEASRLALFDPNHALPFANLEFPKGNRKRHGIAGSLNRNPRA